MCGGWIGAYVDVVKYINILLNYDQCMWFILSYHVAISPNL